MISSETAPMKSVFTNLFAGVALLALTAAPAFADNMFPRAGELWPNDYLRFFSEDMQLVQVTLRRDEIINDGKQITILIPRAWITYAYGYDPLKLSRLPDSIATTNLKIALADPDGTALSIRSRERARLQHISLSEALKQLRADEFQLTLSYISSDIITESLQYGLSIRPEDVVQQDGYRFDPKSGQYVGRTGSDLFYRARCQYSPNQVTFCIYYARPGNNISLKVDFLDFRFHGGLPYANDRLSRLIAAFCKQIEPHCFAVDAHASGDDQR